ncbi:MAG: DUF2127 domain-containing protein [Acidobacteriota bacterium]|nr:DUF2127 domain-containing protein [Acidobacteriota bacterium]
MTDSSAVDEYERKKHNKLLILIALYKSALAILFALVGVGALRLLHQDIGDLIDNVREALHFSPESHLVNFLMDKASLVDDPMLKRIGFLAFSYAAISLLEGIGLYLEKTWGEYLTLIITASFLPWELFEVFRHITWLRVVLIIVNLLVFLYLLKVVVEKKKQNGLARSS